MENRTLTPPAFAGMRENALPITESLPDDLSLAMVTVRTINMKSWGQGFLDELCKQLVEVRSCQHVVFETMNPRGKEYIERSWKLRELTAKLEFV